MLVAVTIFGPPACLLFRAGRAWAGSCAWVMGAWLPAGCCWVLAGVCVLPGACVFSGIRVLPCGARWIWKWGCWPVAVDPWFLIGGQLGGRRLHGVNRLALDALGVDLLGQGGGGARQGKDGHHGRGTGAAFEHERLRKTVTCRGAGPGWAHVPTVMGVVFQCSPPFVADKRSAILCGLCSGVMQAMCAEVFLCRYLSCPGGVTACPASICATCCQTASSLGQGRDWARCT